MSEAIIARGGVGIKRAIEEELNAAFPPTLVTEIINTNTVWTVPSAINNKFTVRLFGGGGGENNSFDGGGYMNNAELTLTPGKMVVIEIGGGKNNAATGGTTMFSTHLSANDGAILNGGDGGTYDGGGIGYQFGSGGGTSARTTRPGTGGIWGGGDGSSHGVMEVLMAAVADIVQVKLEEMEFVSFNIINEDR